MNKETVILGLTTLAFAGLALYFYRRSRRKPPPNIPVEALDRQRNSVLESVLEGLGDSCLLIDSDRRIIFANHETRDLFRNQEKLNYRPLHSLITKERMQVFLLGI